MPYQINLTIHAHTLNFQNLHNPSYFSITKLVYGIGKMVRKRIVNLSLFTRDLAPLERVLAQLFLFIFWQDAQFSMAGDVNGIIK